MGRTDKGSPTRIFVNLKRFEVPRELGGVCPVDDPQEWISRVLRECVSLRLGATDGLSVTFFLPEGLVSSAARELGLHPHELTRNLAIGCQGVYRADIKPGGNFGAFTSHLPATSARHLGCTWALVGHSEERWAMLDLIARYDPASSNDQILASRASACVSEIIGEEASAAVGAGLSVLLCVGETAAERGQGDPASQRKRTEAVLRSQLSAGLRGVRDQLASGRVVVAYEPVWAIGPGRVPPGPDYIAYVAEFIKASVLQEFGAEPWVVYGGGLKEENAAAIGGVSEVDGGLVALTQFSGQIGFDPGQLNGIIARYRAARGTADQSTWEGSR